MKLRFVCALALGCVIIAGGGISKSNSSEDDEAKRQLTKTEALNSSQLENKLAKKR